MKSATLASPMNERMRLRKAPLLLALLVLLPNAAGAIDLEYDAGLTLRRSDNLNLGDTDTVSDTILTPFVRFKATEEGPRLNLLAQGDLQYPVYLDSTYDNQLRGKFSGRLDWALLPDRLDWIVQDYMSTQPVDDLDAYSPDNQQQVNLFVTGPTLHARFGPSTHGQLDLRYGNTHAETSDSMNGDRYSAAARVMHALDANSKVSGNLEAADVRYDGPASIADYRRYDAYVGYARKGPVIGFDFDLGYSQLDREASTGTQSSPLFRGNLDWRMSARRKVRASLRYQYTDATQNLVTPTFEFPDRRYVYLATPDIVVDPNPYQERLGKLSYEYTRERASLRLQPYYRRMEYFDDTVEDQTRRGAVLDVDYRLRPLLTLSLLAAYEHRDYDGISRTDKDSTLGLGLQNQFTRHWIGRIDLRRTERNSTAANRDYTANSAALTIIYRR